MAAVFLPNYSARFVPAGTISSAGDLLSYWKEIQERVGKVFGAPYVSNLSMPGRAVAQIFSGPTDRDDIYVGGTFFRAKKPRVGGGLCAAQYDVVVCSLDGGAVNEIGRKLDDPMKRALKAGRSDVLFPVLIGGVPAMGYDRNLLDGLESDLVSPEIGFATARLFNL